MLKKHGPVSESFMSTEYPKLTICQLLRDTYQLTDSEKIRMNLRVAVSMAKAMGKKLKEYRQDWEEGFWDERN